LSAWCQKICDPNFDVPEDLQKTDFGLLGVLAAGPTSPPWLSYFKSLYGLSGIQVCGGSHIDPDQPAILEKARGRWSAGAGDC
jgi:hypothetical protein